VEERAFSGQYDLISRELLALNLEDDIAEEFLVKKLRKSGPET